MCIYMNSNLLPVELLILSRVFQTDDTKKEFLNFFYPAEGIKFPTNIDESLISKIKVEERGLNKQGLTWSTFVV